MRTQRILVVEDEESLAMVLGDALENEGYETEVVGDGRTALDRALTGRFDLVLLDLMLPRMDGYEVCRRIRAADSNTQVLMLTARGREEDRIKGLDLGADDYVVKPFSLRELLARVRARLRAGDPTTSQSVCVGDAEVDFDAMVVRRNGTATDLTRLEAGVLRLLLANPSKVLSRKQFLDEVWGYDNYPTTRTVDMHVARVREKLGEDGEQQQLIHTVHGVGYRYDPV